MNETDKAELDEAMELLTKARDIIQTVTNRQSKYISYQYLSCSMDHIDEAQLDIRDATLDG